MKRINKILSNEIFKNTIMKIEKLEKNRIYCKHNMNHLFDTARIAYIINIENNYGFEKELIYASALLHDIGRAMEYENNVPHNEAGAFIAEKILRDCQFGDFEIEIISYAILGHRNGGNKNNGSENGEQKNFELFGKILREADKLSRKCFCCNAETSCYWNMKKKNLNVVY